MSFFDPIIRAASDDDLKHARPDRMVMCVDLEERRVVEDSIWNVFSKRYRRFVVMSSLAPDAVVEDTEITAPLSDYEGDEGPLHLKIAYQARCAPGDEAKVAVALAGERDLRAVVRDRIRFWVDEHVDDRQSFIDRYDSRADGLRRELKERARRELGLTLKVKLALVNHEVLKPIEIGPKEIAIRVNGHRDKLKLRLEVTLVAPARLVGKAIQGMARIDGAEGAVVAALLRFFEGEVTLHEFHYGLGGSVIAALREQLEVVAASFGREIGQLQVESASPRPNVPAEYESTVEVDRDLPEYPEKIEVKTHFWMILRDVGPYVERGSPPLTAWAHDAVSQATREVLFSTRYSQLVRNVEAKKNEIEKRTEDKARAIGFDIQQFVAITNLQVDELRESFTVAASERFSTRVPNVLAGLEVHVTARITDTARIEELLDCRADVREAMKQAIRERIARVLHGVDPEEFYLYFDTPWPARSAPSSSLVVAEGDDGERPVGARRGPRRLVGGDAGAPPRARPGSRSSSGASAPRSRRWCSR